MRSLTAVDGASTSLHERKFEVLHSLDAQKNRSTSRYCHIVTFAFPELNQGALKTRTAYQSAASAGAYSRASARHISRVSAVA